MISGSGEQRVLKEAGKAKISRKGNVTNRQRYSTSSNLVFFFPLSNARVVLPTAGVL